MTGTIMRSPLGLVVLAALVASAMAGSKILIVGDSMGEYSCDYLQNVCDGSTVINKGIGGTTAAQWANDDLAFATTAFAGQTGLTHVYISLLGNDFFGECSITAASLQTKLETAFTKIKAAAAASGNSGVSWVFTSYCNPTGIDTCTPGYNVLPIQTAIQAVADANSDVTFADIGTRCGGSNSAYGDAQFFKDNIHLNAKGYCTALSMGAVQTAFGCGSASYTCDGVSGQYAQPTCTPMSGLVKAGGGDTSSIDTSSTGGGTTGTGGTTCTESDAALAAAVVAANGPADLTTCASVKGMCSDAVYGAQITALCPCSCANAVASPSAVVSGALTASATGGRRLDEPVGESYGGFERLDNGSVGGPMADAVVQAMWNCDWERWLPAEYHEIDVDDAWLTDVTFTDGVATGMEYHLRFGLGSTDHTQWPAYVAAISNGLACCQSSGELQQNIDDLAEEAGIESTFQVIAMNPSTDVGVQGDVDGTTALTVSDTIAACDGHSASHSANLSVSLMAVIAAAASPALAAF